MALLLILGVVLLVGFLFFVVVSVMLFKVFVRVYVGQKIAKKLLDD